MTFKRTDLDLILEVLSESTLSDEEYQRLKDKILDMYIKAGNFEILWNQLQVRAV